MIKRLIKWLNSLFKKEHEPKITLEWRKDFAYVLKDNVSIGHVSFYLLDENVKEKTINALKLIEK